MRIRLSFFEIARALSFVAVIAVTVTASNAQMETGGKPAHATGAQPIWDGKAKCPGNGTMVVLPAIPGYYQFIRDVYLDHERYLRRVREDPEDKTIPPDGWHIAALASISPQEFLTIQTYAIQTYQRTEADSDAETKTRGKKDWQTSADRYQQVMQSLIADLKKELNDDTFKRLDDYVLREYRKARIVCGVTSLRGR